MSKIPMFLKQPTERKDYDFDYERAVSDTDYITNVDSVNATPSGLTTNYDPPSGNIVKVWLSSGTANTTYRVTVIVTTNEGRILELEADIYVTDI